MANPSKFWEAFPLRNSLSIFRRRPYIFIFLALLTFILSASFYSYNSNYTPFQKPLRESYPPSKGDFTSRWNFTRDAQNLKLNDEQCDAAFPELFQDINRAVKSRKGNHVTEEEMGQVPFIRGFIRAMIYDQQIYLISAADNVNTRNLATLLALHRAVLTSPTPLPNIEFTLNADDISPDHATWSYARLSHHHKLWLMPDFGYWSWPEPKIGAYGEVQLKATRMDEKVAWKDKIAKLVWRGAMMGLKVREDLLAACEGKKWSDVRKFVWDDDAKGKTHDVLTMDQHCQYKFVAHTEGVSYSARLQNLQNCRSVLVSHKLSWIQHHSHLMRSSGPDQSFVEVAQDFHDLDKTMEILLKKDGSGELERIAENMVTIFRERYLTPAAEACYWRKLIRGWASVSFEPKFYEIKEGKEVWRGLPVESYLLERRMSWDYH